MWRFLSFLPLQTLLKKSKRGKHKSDRRVCRGVVVKKSHSGKKSESETIKTGGFEGNSRPMFSDSSFLLFWLLFRVLLCISVCAGSISAVQYTPRALSH